MEEMHGRAGILVDEKKKEEAKGGEGGSHGAIFNGRRTANQSPPLLGHPEPTI